VENAAAAKTSVTTELTIIGGYVRIFLLSIFPGCGCCAKLALCLLRYALQNLLYLAGRLFAVVVSYLYPGIADCKISDNICPSHFTPP